MRVYRLSQDIRQHVVRIRNQAVGGYRTIVATRQGEKPSMDRSVRAPDVDLETFDVHTC